MMLKSMMAINSLILSGLGSDFWIFNITTPSDHNFPSDRD